MLQADIERVTDRKPAVFFDDLPAVNHVVVIGALSTPLIKRLVNEKKIKVDDLVGKWEKYLLQVVENPFPNIKQALIITGSDKRAVLYAMFELSAQIGVSPWTWWADVPVMKQSAIHILPGRYVFGEPAVKYRGIFINDEEPALGRWAVERYGGFTSPFYERVFELMLRLKANYLWPAMWWASFNSEIGRASCRERV